MKDLTQSYCFIFLSSFQAVAVAVAVAFVVGSEVAIAGQPRIATIAENLFCPHPNATSGTPTSQVDVLRADKKSVETCLEDVVASRHEIYI